MALDGNRALKAEIRLKIVEWQIRYEPRTTGPLAPVSNVTKVGDLTDIGKYKRRLADIVSEARGPDFRIPGMISSTGFIGGVGTLILDFSFTGGALTALSIAGLFTVGEKVQRRHGEISKYHLLSRELSNIERVIDEYQA